MSDSHAVLIAEIADLRRELAELKGKNTGATDTDPSGLCPSQSSGAGDRQPNGQAGPPETTADPHQIPMGYERWREILRLYRDYAFEDGLREESEASTATLRAESELIADRAALRALAAELAGALKKTDEGLVDWQLGAEQREGSDMVRMRASASYFSAVTQALTAALARAKAAGLLPEKG